MKNGSGRIVEPVPDIDAIDARPYADAWEHLQDELRRLDLRLRTRAREERSRADTPPDAFRGLVVSDEEAQVVLDELDGGRDLSAAGDAHDLQELQRFDQRIAQRVAASAGADQYLPFVRLSRLCQWTSFEAQVVVVCLAPELDRRYEKLYGYLQDDVTRRRPTVALILDLLCTTAEEQLAARMFFDPHAPLFRDAIVRMGHGSDENALPLLSRPLTIDDRIVDYLLGRQRIDARLGDGVRLVMPDDATVPVTDSALEQRIERLIEASDQAPRRDHTVFYLFGSGGSEARAIAEHVCGRLSIPLVVADLERVFAAGSPPDAARVLVREALLLPAALCLENFDALIDDPAKSALHLRPLLHACRQSSRLTFLIGRRPWMPSDLASHEPFFSVHVKLPELGASPAVWASLGRASSAAALLADDVDWGSLASRFRLGPTAVRDVLVVAGNLARWRTPSDPRITMDDLSAACRAVGAARLASLSRKVDSRIGWDDLVLPANAVAQLKELCDQATYRHVVLGDWGFDAKLPLGRGLSALFCGPPGTGKTMAAQVVAGELGLDLHRIDLSQVVSKYIGETEKNLRHVFDEAEATHALLFFDEADALFGKRSEVKDAHDRYANIEVGYLLQKMEEFEGIAILATNVRQNLDEAFVRRLRFIVEFPFPDEDDRRRIWQVTFPRQAPLAPDVDFRALAREIRLAGAHIRNIGLAAAFYAASRGGAIDMRHLVQAARREFEKLGRSWDDSACTRIDSLASREAGAGS